jgi:hypothetical protein
MPNDLKLPIFALEENIDRTNFMRYPVKRHFSVFKDQQNRLNDQG